MRRGGADANVCVCCPVTDAVDTAEHEAVARINASIGADGRSVAEIGKDHTRRVADHRVVAARRVAEAGVPAEESVAGTRRVVSASAVSEEGVVTTALVFFSSLVAEKGIAEARCICLSRTQTSEEIGVAWHARKAGTANVVLRGGIATVA